MMVRPVWVFVFAVACGAKGGDAGPEEEIGPAPSDLPDVSGRYNVQIAAATGCEGQSYWLEDWVPGPMSIEGEPGGLEFNFGDPMVFGGSVNETRKYTFEGEVEDVPVTLDTGDVSATLSVFNDGDFDQGTDGCWLMSGTFEVVVDDDGILATNCTITGPVEAYQLQGAECNGLGKRI